MSEHTTHHAGCDCFMVRIAELEAALAEARAERLRFAKTVDGLAEYAFQETGRCPLCRSGRGTPKPHADWCDATAARAVLEEDE